ncbi:MAG TPA: TetR/AcrR family transcriptional regulator [Vicinamibacterales bacterium]|jgi:AcrR family transcriptional regulator
MTAAERPRTRADSTLGDSDYVARQEQIRTRAREIFARHGYRKTTIEDIGKACGLGKAALYHYFSSKEEIFAAVVRAEGDKVLAQIRAAVGAAGDPRAKLVAALRTSFRAVSARVGEIIENKGAAELRESLPLAARYLQHLLDEEVEILRKILAEGARRGVFKKISSPSVPLLIISGLRGVESHLLDFEDPPQLDDAIDAILELFLEGLCR